MKLEQSTLALELFYIGFIFYQLQETVCEDKNSETESLLGFGVKGQVVCVSKYRRCRISSERSPSWPDVSPAALLLLSTPLKEAGSEWICLVLVSGSQQFRSLMVRFAVGLLEIRLTQADTV